VDDQPTKSAAVVTITLSDQPHTGCIACPVIVTFTARKTSGTTLNFDLLPDNFYIVFSNNQRFSGQPDLPGMNFDNNQPQQFNVTFRSLSIDQFRDFTRRADIDYYIIGFKSFSSQIGETQWKKNLPH
jgi:hypothetical protein